MRDSWLHVTPSNPCPACGKPDWCKLAADGSAAFCRRSPEGPDGPGIERNDCHGEPFWIHRLNGTACDWAPSLLEVPAPACGAAKPETMAAVYSGLMSRLSLSKRHRNDLLQRGFTDEEITRAQYRTLPLEGRSKIAKSLAQEHGSEACTGTPGLYMKSEEGRSWWTLAGSPGLLIPLRDEAGRIQAVQIRRDEADGGDRYRFLSSRKHGGLGPVRGVHVPAHPLTGDVARLTEGPLKADMATFRTGILTLAVAGVGRWTEALPVLRKFGPARVLIAFDADWRTKAHVARALLAACQGLAEEGFIVAVEAWPEDAGKGIDDVLRGGGSLDVLEGDRLGELLAQAASAANSANGEGAAVMTVGDPLKARLSALQALPEGAAPMDARTALLGLAAAIGGLNRLDATALRAEAIAELRRVGLNADTARSMVDAAFATGKEDGAQGRGLDLREPEPWPAPVETTDLLEDVARLLRRYLVLPAPAYTAIPLWVLHSWTYKAADTTPRLRFTSATKRSGKSRSLEVLRPLVARGLKLAGVTPSALFRVVEDVGPTLLIDEADNLLKDPREKSDLLGILNEGQRRGGSVLRCVGEDHEPRLFSCWCPVIIAGIGNLPDTLTDRSITVAMARQAPGEKVERLRQGHHERACEDVRRRLVRWTKDNLCSLRDASPALPDALNDRAQDGWEPLLAIADLAGGDWPEQARKAALSLAGADLAEGEDVAVTLLGDIQAVFNDRGLDRLSSQTLLDALIAMEERPWPTWHHGKPLSARALAERLRPFGVRSGTVRLPDGSTAKGFKIEQFKEAWTRHLPSTPSGGVKSSVTTSQPSNDGGLCQISSVTNHPLVTDGDRDETPSNGRCDVVTDEEGACPGVGDCDPLFGGAAGSSADLWEELIV